MRTYYYFERINKWYIERTTYCVLFQEKVLQFLYFKYKFDNNFVFFYKIIVIKLIKFYIFYNIYYENIN